MITVEKLRRAGYKVKVTHSRTYVTDEFFYRQYCLSKFELREKLSSWDEVAPLVGPLEFGGQSLVEITSPDGEVNVHGVARCSLSDRFNRKLGLKIAFGRALDKIPLVNLKNDKLSRTTT